ncbi:hypothetical protein FD755_010405, partial [Muntiacus reevesi]
TCRLLLRGFTTNNGRQHHMDEFSRRNVPSAIKEIGSTMSGGKGPDDALTLQLQKFQMGDYLHMAITPAHRAPPPSERMRPH